MAIQTQPSRIPEAFAGSGTRNIIPATNATPSASQAASWASGFPPECSQPISAGGCPVPRNDVNGALNQMSQDYAFRQDGGIWEWSAVADYDVNRLVLGSDGVLYWSVAQSGPTLGGAKDPTVDSSHLYWGIIEVPTASVNNDSNDVATTRWVRTWYSSIRPVTKYYVNPVSGSDENTGENQSAPAKTYAHILSEIASKTASRPSKITIYLSAGIYNERILNNFSDVYIEVIGPSSGVASFTGIELTNPNTTTIFGQRIQTTGPLQVARGANVILSDGLYLNFDNLGSVESAIKIYLQSCVSTLANASVTFEYTGTNDFTEANLNVFRQGVISFANLTVVNSGTVSGKRYSLIGCSIVAGTGSITKFPGDVAGTVDSTSQYS